MGVVSSKPDDNSAIFFKDQNRFTISSLSITNSKNRPLLSISPNAFPATKAIVRRDASDESPVDFIQDPDASPASLIPNFLLKLNANAEDLHFNFVIALRQGSADSGSYNAGPNPDTTINGLTFVFASTSRELDVLVTREFHADPNLHKNSNVDLVGAEFSTGGSPSVQFNYTWKWRPPKGIEDKGGGWRNACTFVEYDQRAHRLNTLATFSFWVQNPKISSIPVTQPPPPDTLAPPKIRVASSQSAQTVMSDSEGQSEKDLPSPVPENDYTPPISQIPTNSVIDVNCQRPGDDVTAVEDGPLFRATIKALEQKTGSMRTKMKKVIKKAEAAQSAQVQCNEAVSQFMEALREASASNANAIQPALEHYFEKIARQILIYENQNTRHLQKLIIDPLSKLYNIDIKQAESKKKDFEDESKEFYAYVGRYLGQRQDSLKEKKKADSDTKYQSKRRNFELKRFDYSSFMQDLHGGRKEQEVLSHLTSYADTQAKSFLATAKTIEEMVPQLDALSREVSEAGKEYQIQRTEREEKRRVLEKSAKSYFDLEPGNAAPASTVAPSNGVSAAAETDIVQRDSSVRSALHHTSSTASSTGLSRNASTTLAPTNSTRSIAGSPITSPGQDRFKGFRDLEERSYVSGSQGERAAVLQRKEGLLWALSRPGSHVDPRGLNKQAWHKFWIVLDQGKLSEYSNWKESLDLHMEPIDLRLASVREARNSERRFCFEIITPSFKRVYQATSEDDMNNWISAINNALQSAFETRSQAQAFDSSPIANTTFKRDIGSVLTGRSSQHAQRDVSSSGQSNPGNSSTSNNSNMSRRITVSARPSYVRTDSNSYNENPTKLLEDIRDRHRGNSFCADCNSNVKTEWVSINLGIILCIECSGIHRSLGTHVSKVRSLTLDTVSFTSDIVEIIFQIGNDASNKVWEARLDQTTKPLPSATRDQRLRFIQEKYVERLYVNPISSTLSHYATADETLIASIKKNDILQVLYALALRASPNATDKSRNTHALYLALAAADPASPHTSSAATSPRSANSAIRGQPVFPIAELLLQNGSDMPSTMPAFPLSKAALQFIEQRGTSDAISTLPNIRSPASPQERDREKLQKRTSAGGRFSGRGIGFNG